MKREVVIKLVDRQIIRVKDGDEVAFLIKHVTFPPKIRGLLTFLGVVLTRISLQDRPNQYILNGRVLIAGNCTFMLTLEPESIDVN